LGIVIIIIIIVVVAELPSLSTVSSPGRRGNAEEDLYDVNPPWRRGNAEDIGDPVTAVVPSQSGKYLLSALSSSAIFTMKLNFMPIVTIEGVLYTIKLSH
jgi:hypothetical protein